MEESSLEVDISPIKQHDSDEEVKSIGEKILAGMKEHGYGVLRNTGLRDADSYRSHLAAIQEFVALPNETKKATKHGQYFGYRGQALETLDLSEEGSDVGLVQSVSYNPHDNVPYPPREPDFRSVIQKYYSTCHNVAMDVLDSISLALGKERGFLRPYHEHEEYITLRSSIYEAVDKDLPSRFTRFGAHTDFDTFTLIIPEANIGGLEIQNPQSGEWSEPAVDEDTVICIPGDVLQCWTNGNVMALNHRVNLPSDERRLKSRHSLIFFVTPDPPTPLAPLDGSHNLNLKFETYEELATFRFAEAETSSYS